MKTARLEIVRSNSPVVVRSASILDLNEIIDLENEVWQPAHRCSSINFVSRISKFSDGFLLAESEDGKLVGTFYGIKREFNPGSDRSYTWEVESGGGTGSTHVENGNAIFGVSATVHPLAPKGTLRLLFNEWRNLARRHDAKYIFGGSRLPSYHQHKQIPIDVYVKKVMSNEVIDPVLTKYIACGLKVGKPLPNYFYDFDSLHYGVEVFEEIVNLK